MFVTVQFPMADLRPFLEGTGRLNAPPWPLAEPARHFVRSLGGVQKRRRGGLTEWVGEDVYCDVRSGFSLELPSGAFRQVGLRPLWRRYYATGGFHWPGVVTRMEVGFAARIPRSLPSGMLSIAARNMAELTVNVPAAVASTPRPAPLGTCGSRLARLLLAATTSHSAAAPPRNWWMRAGQPIALAEIPAAPGESTSTLAVQELHTLRVDNVEIPLWVLHYGPGTDRGELRRLRIHLWRIHQEREVLRIALAACLEKRLDPTTSPALRDYLAQQSKWLGKARTEGFPQRELLSHAYRLDALVEPGGLEKLKSMLSQLGPGLVHSVVSVAGQNAGSAHATNVIVYQSGGRMVVHEGSGQHVDVGGGTVGNIVGGDVDNSMLVGVQNVTDSWKTFAAGTDMKQLAEELAVLRASLKQQAVTPEHDIAVAEIAKAEVAAAAEKPEEARSALKKAGTWAFGVATSIGVAFAAGAIKAATGL